MRALAWRLVPRDEWETVRLQPGQRLQLDLGPPWTITADWYFDGVLRAMSARGASQGWVPAGWWWDPKAQVLTLFIEVTDQAQGTAEASGALRQAGWPVWTALTVAAVAVAVGAYFGYKSVREVRLFWGDLSEGVAGKRWLPWAVVALVAGALAVAWRWSG